jgi:hypothetical protein
MGVQLGEVRRRASMANQIENKCTNNVKAAKVVKKAAIASKGLFFIGM